MRLRQLALCVCSAVVALAQPVATQPGGGADWVGAAAALPTEGFARPSGAFVPVLPRDHAPHPEAATESWQLSVHLHGSEGAAMGLQMSLLRLGLVPPDAAVDALPDSGWAARGIYRGHVTILAGDAAAGEERFGRAMAGVAGLDAADGVLRLDDWTLDFGAPEDAAGWRLAARAGDLRATLALVPQRSPAAIGAEALPLRGYAVTRLAVTGRIETPQGPQTVTGTAWFEHLWGELPLPGGGPVASDRLLLQLDDGGELSMIRTRRVDGRGAPTLEAVLIAPDGSASALQGAEVDVVPQTAWAGRLGDWPLVWQLRAGDLELAVTPVVEDQEHGFAAPAWIGVVRAEGRRGDRAVRGLGTLQLTGYGTP